MLNRTDSLTHGDCGNQDMVTIAELCLNRIESYTAGLSGYKYSTVAMDCNSGVWAFLLCVSTRRHRIPFLGIQPSNVPSGGSLEQMVHKLREELKDDGAHLFGLIFLAYLDIGGECFCLFFPLFAFMCTSYVGLALAALSSEAIVQQVVI